ncbi:MAG: hypothetical protein O9322_13060 [Beijerinckiaceae bacterium]|nr:hypothetical protein [Beijerinckiaceae bacterium]MCZ8300272.1 hypothetical protein [Beijerinckiaceae bacterium]
MVIRILRQKRDRQGKRTMLFDGRSASAAGTVIDGIRHKVIHG